MRRKKSIGRQKINKKTKRKKETKNLKKEKQESKKSRKSMIRMDGSKKAGPKRRNEIGGLKQMGLNEWVKIDGSKWAGPKIPVKKHGLKKLGQIYRSKKTGPNRGVQIRTEMSPKLKYHLDSNVKEEKN